MQTPLYGIAGCCDTRRYHCNVRVTWGVPHGCSGTRGVHVVGARGVARGADMRSSSRIPERRRDNRGANRVHGNTYPATLRLRPHDEGEEFLRNIVGTKDQYHALQALDLYAGLCPKPQGYVMKADWIRALNTLVKREEPMWTGGHKLFWR